MSSRDWGDCCDPLLLETAQSIGRQTTDGLLRVLRRDVAAGAAGWAVLPRCSRKILDVNAADG